MGNIFSGSFLSIADATLFMPNKILKRFIKNKKDFHQKFAKIEDFKVDHSKKTTKFNDNRQNSSNLL